MHRGARTCFPPSARSTSRTARLPPVGGAEATSVHAWFTFVVMECHAPHMDRIAELCRPHRVKGLYAFGSAARGDRGPGSDGDLLLDLPLEDPEAFTEHYGALDQALGLLLQRPVDLVPERALHNRYFIQELERTKIPLHEA